MRSDEATKALAALLARWEKEDGVGTLSAPSFLFQARSCVEAAASLRGGALAGHALARGIVARQEMTLPEIAESLRILEPAGLDLGARDAEGRTALGIVLACPPDGIEAKNLIAVFKKFGTDIRQEGLSRADLHPFAPDRKAEAGRGGYVFPPARIVSGGKKGPKPK